MRKENDQITLFNLVFTHNWEDPESDHAALKIQSNDAVVAITSGACNVLGFLLFDPEVIYSIDINPSQSFLLELKIAAIKCMTFDEFISFSGLHETNSRLEAYQRIRPFLSKKALEFWDQQQTIISRGFVMQGKYERFIRLAGKFIMILQGKKRVLGLFSEKSKAERERYFDKVWNTKRFYYMFKILFNKRILAKRGLVADYFHFDDGSKYFAESFYNRSKKAFRDLPANGNYFLSLYLLGKYNSDDEVPLYLKKENYDTIKARVNRIRIITSDAQGWIDSMPGEMIDCFALSNICELMSDKDTKRLFNGVVRTARNGARIIFRNLMIPREVPTELQGTVQKDEVLSRTLYDHDRSFVYGKVAAYTIHK
ncbi:MAG: BtaA family protein [Cyclobacteriaceae bacterium]|nr:BtaA family protein [Cyclobacteriaceae bacterium]